MNELMRQILFLPPQASTVARDIDLLHYFVILMTMAGAGLVTLVGGYFLLRYSRGGPRRGSASEIPLGVELGVVFGLLGLFVLWWLIGFHQMVRLRVAPEDSLQVYVQAKQWMWSFAYPDGTGSVATLVVPEDRPIKLVMTSRDVIHSFYVPQFRVKQDVLPGRYTTVWFQADRPGVYDIFCTEYCGTSHSTMRGQVVVLAPTDFERWMSGHDQVPGAPNDGSLATEGQRVAAGKGCLACHTVDGSRHIGPSWAGVYGALMELDDGTTVRADEAYLTESMMDPMAKKHHGFKAVMPSYRGLLTPADSAALVEYIKSLRDLPSPRLGQDAP